MSGQLNSLASKLSSEKSELKSTIYESVGGSSTHIVINFHLLNGPGQIVEVPIYFGSMITISYSVYRSKQSVFNMGSKLIDGFAIGNKYVAGTLIKGVFDNDELNSALNTIRNVLIDNFSISNPVSASNNNVIHSIMKDDILSCDINILYTNEYTGKIQMEVIHDATFINNGQVASINDIITETTISYIARSVKSMHEVSEQVKASGAINTITTATSLL